MTTEIRVRAYLLSSGDSTVLVNRTKAGFRMFGGRVKGSETIRQALRRELYEELGIQADIGVMLSVEERYKGRGKRQRRIMEVIFLVRVSKDIALTPEDGMTPTWVPTSDVGMRLGERLA